MGSAREKKKYNAKSLRRSEKNKETLTVKSFALVFTLTASGDRNFSHIFFRFLQFPNCSKAQLQNQFHDAVLKLLTVKRNFQWILCSVRPFSIAISWPSCSIYKWRHLLLFFLHSIEWENVFLMLNKKFQKPFQIFVRWKILIFFPCTIYLFSSIFLNPRSKKNNWTNFVFPQYLPPTTLHDKIISSPSCMGPILVPFSCRPHRSNITGDSGKTVWQKRRRRRRENWDEKIFSFDNLWHVECD